MTALFITAGQSNALGYGLTAADVPAHLVLPNPSAYIFDGTNWGQLRPGVNTGTPANPQAWGPEAELAYRYGLDHPGEVLLIVKSAKGSTGLAADGDRLDWSPDSAGELFDFTDARIDAARAAFTAATGEAAPGVSAAFWMQGEQDATNAADAGAYATNLAHFLEAVRLEWMDNPAGYIGLGRIGDSPGLAYAAEVRVAQWSVDQADASAESFKTIGYGLQSDGLHYDAAGQTSLGGAFYDAWAF